MRRLLISLLLTSLATAAWATPRLTAGPGGDLYRFDLVKPVSGEGTKLVIARSIDQGVTFGASQELYAFSAEVYSCDLKIGQNGTYFFTYSTSSEIFYVDNQENDKNFAPPQIITTEAASAAALAQDSLERTNFIYVTTDQLRATQRLDFLPGLSAEAKVLYESQADIISPRIVATPWALVVYWQQRYADRLATLITVSVNQGQHFGAVKILPAEFDLNELIYFGNKWVNFALGKTLTQSEIKFTPPAAPLLSKIICQPTVEVVYQPQSADPVIGKLDISPSRSFPPDQTWSFSQLVAGSREVTYPLPVDLPDGAYFLTLSIFDGLASSAHSPLTAFKLDRTPPTITLTSPTAEVSEQEFITLAGQVSEPAKLTLNGQPLTVESSGVFSLDYDLVPGNNSLTLVATDENGNTSTLARKISFKALRPGIILLKPRTSDWYRSGSTVVFDATVKDYQGDIADESEADLELNGQVLADKLVYSKSDGQLSGFIKLPDGLSDGKLAARISLADQAGNVGVKDFTVNIDNQPPVLTLTAGATAYSSSGTMINLPVQDSGAGLDRPGTQLAITGVSFEVLAMPQNGAWLATTESGLLIKPRFPLPDGSYEAAITPRDLVGNTGTAEAFHLIVDSIPPVITASGTSEPNGKFLFTAAASDQYFDGIKIYDNDKLVNFFSPPVANFERAVPLLSGNNELRIVAYDQAGNSASQTLFALGVSSSAAALVNKFGNGPNPFSPARDGQMAFTYDLSSPADLKFYIFNLGGTLLWKKEVNNTGTGSLAWNGRDQFGALVNNGVYPYIIQAASGNALELKRGKIIILQ